MLSALEKSPHRLAVYLLSTVPMKALRALEHAHSAAAASCGSCVSSRELDAHEEGVDRAADDELLFFVGKAGDPQAASVWAEDAEPEASTGSEDDEARARLRPLSASAGEESQPSDASA